MMFTSSNQWVLVGVTSSGIGCGEAKYMGLYTRVDAFENWIRSYTNGALTTPRNLTASSIYPHTNSIAITITTSVHYLFFFALTLFLSQN